MCVLFLFVKFMWRSHGSWLVDWFFWCVFFLSFIWLKLSWSKKMVRKWFNIKSKTEDFQADDPVYTGAYFSSWGFPTDFVCLFVWSWNLFDFREMYYFCTSKFNVFLAFHEIYYPIKSCQIFYLESIKDSKFILFSSLFPLFSLQPNKAIVYIL